MFIGEADTDKIEVANKFLVGAAGGPAGGRLVSVMLRREFTRADALNLAAWLVVLSGVEREAFDRLLDRVCNT